jgi:hypothetical protein
MDTVALRVPTKQIRDFSTSVSSDSHAGSVVVQSYQCSLFYITFFNF